MDLRWIAIAAAGAAGAVGRVAIARAVPADVTQGEFPAATLIVNVVGSLVLGGLVGIDEALSPSTRAILIGGLCGAFTTFSTFAFDLVALWSRGERGLAAAYLGLQLVVGIGAVIAGLWIGRAAAG